MYTAAAEPRFKIFAPMLKASVGGDGKKRLHGIASSTIKDRHGDTMTFSALADMERSAQNNLTIFLNHEYRVPEDVAGSVERAMIRSHPQDPDIHDLTLDIVVNESNPRAVSAWEAIQNGTQLGLSIGAMIPDGGATRDRKTGTYIIDHVELLETSLVGVPANPRSWVEYAVKSLGGIEKELEATDLEHTDDPLTEEELPEEPETEVTSDDLEGLEPDSITAEVEPDITDATVSIETPFANINIDTGNRGGSKPAASDGSSQEALLSAPEDEEETEDEKPNPWAAIGLSGEPEVEEVEPELQDLEPTVMASMRTSNELLKAMTRELIDTKAALENALLERDAAVAMTEKVVTSTAEILEKLANTPVGRRAVFRETTEQFGSLKSVYGEEFVTLLKKG